MTITVDNSLGGTVGTSPSVSSLEATARAGVVVPAVTARAEYTATRTVRSLTVVEVATGYARSSTPSFEADLPASGPWSARWYVYMPPMQSAGFGIHEVRWHCAFPDAALGLVVHETGAGNVGTRLQPDDLDAAYITWDTETGSATSFGQWWRIELVYDGADLTCYTYAGHATTGARIHIWNSRDVGRTLRLGGYRYRRNFYLPYGNATFDQTVQDYQNYLINLGYPAPQWGADGFYGDEMAGQLDSFAADYGFGDLVGTFGSGGGAGAEVLAGISLAHAEDQGNPLPLPLHLSHLAVSDGGLIGPADTPAGTAWGSLLLSDSTSGHKAGAGTASGTLSLAPSPDGAAAKAGTAAAAADIDTASDGHKEATGSASAGTTLATTATGHKQGHGDASAALAVSTLAEGSTGNRADAALTLTGTAAGHKAGAGAASESATVTAAATGRKHAHGTASAGIVVSTVAGQTIEPIPAVTGTAAAVGQLAGDVLAIDRLAGTARPIGRLAGHVERE